MTKNVVRAYPPVPYPERLPLVEAYYAKERTPEQVAVLDAEIARTRMTEKKAERILKTWVRMGFAPFSAMDIAELEILKRKYGDLHTASKRVLGEER